MAPSPGWALPQVSTRPFLKMKNPKMIKNILSKKILLPTTFIVAVFSVYSVPNLKNIKTPVANFATIQRITSTKHTLQTQVIKQTDLFNFINSLNNTNNQKIPSPNVLNPETAEKININNLLKLLKPNTKTIISRYLKTLKNAKLTDFNVLTKANTKITKQNLTSLQIIKKYSFKIPRSTIIKTTENLPYGKSVVKQEGKDGKMIVQEQIQIPIINQNFKLNDSNTTYKILESTKPVPKIIEKGAPKTYRTTTVNGETIRYYRKLNVWATSYDSSCKGCNNITATGRILTYGIIAVDPRVIPLHTCIYVPGYGYGQAEDTGGAIKGNKIDLAFEDVQYGWWSARHVDIYIMDCKDAKLPWNK